MKKNAAGFTLLEVILVLVISALLFVLGYKFYLSIRSDADISQVQYNVDRIFSSAAEYYQANCRQQLDPLTGNPGATNPTAVLDPVNSPVSPVAVTVSALRTAGFLQATLPINRLINPATINGGYVVQFNQTPLSSPSTDVRFAGVKIGNIIYWNIQVSVAIRSTTPLAIVRMLGADCASNLAASGNTVNPCNSGIAVSTAQTVYAVWERAPSYAAPNAEANTWMGNAQVRSFNQLYTNSNIVNGQPGPSGTQANYQNYLCGG